MSAFQAGLTSTQKGSITEYAVATALMLASEGRLSVFTPLADDHGIDLIIYDKRSEAMLPVQVKSWTKSPSARGTIQFDVQKTTFEGGSASVLIAVLFEPARAAIKLSWLMSMDEVAEGSVSRRDKYALSPSVREETTDRYRRFRHDDLGSLVSAVIEKLRAISAP